MNTISQLQMPQHDSAAAHRAMRANACTASDTGTTRHRCMGPHMHVVPNLHQVVELDAVFNDRVIQGAAVNARVGPNFYIVANAHCTQLLNFEPLAAMWGKTEAISPHHDPRMQNAARTNHTVKTHRDLRSQAGVLANARARAHKALRADVGTGFDNGTGFDHGLGADDDVGADDDGRVERFEVPNLWALNFILHDSLGGGGTLSLKTDAQGKTHAQGILALELEVPDSVLATVGEQE